MSKCASYGLSGFLLNWIEAFLSDRTFRVKVSNTFSEWAPVSSGVPQGTILGPTLFLIYINDVITVCGGTVCCKMYADDLKLYSEIRDANDTIAVQTTLADLQQWSQLWQLPIAKHKCSVLHIGKKNTGNVYTIDNSVIPAEKVCRDLGVYVTSDLSWSYHCSHISKKANDVTNMLFRCFLSASQAVLLKAYKVYVRPHLEYCSSVWSPYLKKDIIALTKVQNYFTRRLFANCRIPYCCSDERDRYLHLETLEIRRVKADLIMVYKIIFKQVSLELNDFFEFAPDRGTRGHNFKLRANTSHLDVRQKFFACRVVNIWNLLPANVSFTRRDELVVEPLILARNSNLFKIRLAYADLPGILLRTFAI